jgi:hypothetical protein
VLLHAVVDIEAKQSFAHRARSFGFPGGAFALASHIANAPACLHAPEGAEEDRMDFAFYVMWYPNAD